MGSNQIVLWLRKEYFILGQITSVFVKHSEHLTYDFALSIGVSLDCPGMFYVECPEPKYPCRAAQLQEPPGSFPLLPLEIKTYAFDNL